jgi:large subunit ribosomal protein L13
MNTKTYQPKVKEMKRSWHLFDAKGQVLGRLATQVATILIGKHKADYSAHLDSGDFVVILNAEKITLTGKKMTQKKYYRHSGYPGGFKEISIEKMFSKDPRSVLKHSVSGMLPDNRLKRDRLERLMLIVGEKNPDLDKFPAN